MTARPRAAAVLAAVAAAGTLLDAHELFLRPRGFFVAPGATITLPIVDGTFAASGNAIEPQRIRDLSRLGPDGRVAIARATWTSVDPRSTVRVPFAGPGTYAVGVELAAAPIARAGAAFDRYLQEEGITVLLDRRRATGRLGRRARESYARAAKTLIAVTDAAGHVVPPPRGAGSAALTPLGYPAEIVALVDPYSVGVGAAVPIRALVGGRPLAGWRLRAGGTIGTSTAAIPSQELTTDREGRAEVRLTHDGHWFVSFVHLAERTPGSGADDLLRAATLTFGVLPR